MKRMTLWGRTPDDETLIEQVLSGAKSVTCTPKVWYYNNPAEEPTEPGDLVELVNARGERRATIEILRTYEVPFGRVSPEVVAGECCKSIEEFWRCHHFCWDADLCAQGTQLNDETLIVVEHFRLVKTTAQ